MKELGLGLMLIGALSLAIRFFNPHVQYIFLTWVDNWGETTGWLIRGGILLLGIVLWVGGKRQG